MGVLEDIESVKKEMNRTQKNKATEHHLGRLKAKLAKLESQLIADAHKGSGGKGTGFDVAKTGQARIALVGFPSVGKSSLMNLITTTESAAASYAFTTLTCVPGVIHIHGAPIQLLDLPGIVQGAARGVGRGRQVIATARTADLIIMMLDACHADRERKALTEELRGMGIRLNCSEPDIELQVRERGGVHYTSTVPLTHLDALTIKAMMQEYKCHNVDIVFRCDATTEDLIDKLEGSRVYLPCVYLVNKIDMVTVEACEHFASQPHHVVCSVHERLNIRYLHQVIWERLGLVRIYTKPRSGPPDLDPNDALILKRGNTIKHVCLGVHRDMLARFEYATVYGASVRHGGPQRCGLTHVIEDEDVVTLVAKR
eukprot:gnl/Dysnectes_brevis/1678_a1908_1052.p1 GENE.gnl/Dysnectes_brevis/1678_a1908_1052~~gnl/Dysnectes_brevis/1678_a1908_1052.p1  ORF type:complete len:370 (+),score=122.95 gnl/Dysnectes_brevis/1678_a1908_1052:514-1623(+)